MKVWLLLSQPPGCLCIRTSFPTWRALGTLAVVPGCFSLGHGPYQSQPDCHALYRGILSLVKLGTQRRARIYPVLYLRDSPHDASPKAISGSTSYLQVCLVFRSDPQLIPTLFSGFRFGPPHRLTGASAWPWIDHLASGPCRATVRPLQTRFPYGSGTSIP